MVGSAAHSGCQVKKEFRFFPIATTKQFELRNDIYKYNIYIYIYTRYQVYRSTEVAGTKDEIVFSKNSVYNTPVVGPAAVCFLVLTSFYFPVRRTNERTKK